ncbi:MAG: TOBE domain-containing protein, partial [Hyphomicrobiaceae bacterium]
GLFGRILHVRFLGDVAHVDVGIEGFDQPLKVRVLETVAPTKGTEVGIEINPASVLVFPAQAVE